jgi:energy-coupling factor transporter ATP-binding protein EcfA2
VPGRRELPVGRFLEGDLPAAGVRSDVETSSPSPVAINARDLGLTVSGDRGEDIVVLRGCSLQIPEGEFWMLLGPNGCGKSTLLKVLTGLLRPNRGKLFIVGPRSFVFQNPDHQVVMPTAEADVAFGLGHLELTDEEVKTRVYTSLEAVGMGEYGQRPVQTLSGGQKQRVAIAGALAESSRVLLLDELTTFLDEADQIGVLEAVRSVVGGSVTALWVTHRLEELDYADGAVYMENGRVVLSGSVDDVKRYIHKQQEETNGNGVLR